MNRAGKITTWSLALVLGVFSLACAPGKPGDGKPSEGAHPPAVGQPPKIGNGGGDDGKAQPAPVQGDPSAHNTQPGEVALFLEWNSENKSAPLCEWTRNGAVNPCTNPYIHRSEKFGYIGSFQHDEKATAGMTYTIVGEGTGAVTFMECSISWKNNLHVGKSTGRRCSVSLTLD